MIKHYEYILSAQNGFFLSQGLLPLSSVPSCVVCICVLSWPGLITRYARAPARAGSVTLTHAQWDGSLLELYLVLGELENMHQSAKAQLVESQEAGQGPTSKSAAAAAAEATAAAMQAADKGIARVRELRDSAEALQLSTQVWGWGG